MGFKKEQPQVDIKKEKAWERKEKSELTAEYMFFGYSGGEVEVQKAM